MMTHDEMIAVIQHHKDGGEVEFYNDKFWNKVDGIPSWDFRTYMYRPYIEPKPKQVVVIERWLCEYCGGYVVVDGNDLNFMRNEMFKKVKLLETYEVEI